MAYVYSPFRKNYKTDVVKAFVGCGFCNDPLFSDQVVISTDGVAVENPFYQWVVCKYPRFDGHTMLVPKRHITTFAEESSDEILARQHLLVYADRILRERYPGAGVEVFLQNGEGSSSSIAHLHWHLVPARPDDPLRSFEKMGQFLTMEEGKEKVVLFPQVLECSPTEFRASLQSFVTATPYVFDR